MWKSLRVVKLDRTCLISLNEISLEFFANIYMNRNTRIFSDYCMMNKQHPFIFTSIVN